MSDAGKFHGDLVLRYSGGDYYTLGADLTWERNGVFWYAYDGQQLDGASIPRIFWRVTGHPFTTTFVRASVIHDAYCDSGLRASGRSGETCPCPKHPPARPWREVHDEFWYMAIADGTGGAKAWAMWLAVRGFGPRWGTN